MGVRVNRYIGKSLSLLSEALRDYDLEEYFEDEVLKKNSSEFAQFKNINVTVRHVQHRKIVITQAEKLRDGFFLKTKTQRKKSKMMEWTLDEWACPSQGSEISSLLVWTFFNFS